MNLSDLLKGFGEILMLFAKIGICLLFVVAIGAHSTLRLAVPGRRAA